VLSANTVFLSARYRNACGSPGDADPGQATLAWLEAELSAAKQSQEHVWLVYHIPPGIDGYATFRQGACPATIIPMWDQAYAEPFYALLRCYADTVVASFAGHTHMDDFRLIGDSHGRHRVEMQIRHHQELPGNSWRCQGRLSVCRSGKGQRQRSG
jgi:hypothetical protein